MARNPSGTYIRDNGIFSGNDLWAKCLAAGRNIIAADHDAEMNDVEDALTDSLCRSGKGAMLADLNVGGFRVVQMADGVSLDHAATVKQVNFARTHGGLTTGVANVYTITLSAPPVAYVDGQLFTFIAHQGNTGAISFGITSLVQLGVEKGAGGIPLASGDIATGDLLTVQYVASLTKFRVVSTSRIALGLGTMSTVDSPAPVANGGTGATTATNARTNLLAALRGANNDITTMTELLSARAPSGQGLLLGANATNYLNIATTGILEYGFGATKDFEIKQNGDNTSVFGLRGGTNGGQIRLYGGSNGSFPHQIRLDTTNANIVMNTGTGKLSLSSPLALADGGTAGTSKATAQQSLGIQGTGLIELGSQDGETRIYTAPGIGGLFRIRRFGSTDKMTWDSNGDIQLTHFTTGTPANAVTPAAYWKIQFSGVNRYIPLFS